MTNRTLLPNPEPVTPFEPNLEASLVEGRTSGSAGFDPTEPLVVTVREAGRMLRLGRSTIFELLRTNKLERRRVGQSTRVTVRSIRELAGV
jgi:hypothetical protein